MPKQPARAHPEDRAKIETLNAANKLFHGEVKEKPSLSYYTPLFIKCTLPHSDPKTRDWKKSSADFTLVISSGVDDNLEPYGIPYGSFPRLVLAYIITQVIETRERRVQLSSHFGSFLQEVGYIGNYKGASLAARRVREQLVRLLKAQITVNYHRGDARRGGFATEDMRIAPKFALWWDFETPDQESLFTTWLQLSEDFFNEIIASPVPLRTEIIKALRKSPLAIDVYMWVSYRLYGMQQSGQEELSLSYGSLQEQFGTGIAKKNYRNFRHELRLAFEKVKEEWQKPDENGKVVILNCDLEESRLILYRSQLLVGKPKQIGLQAGDEAILKSRRFDDATRKKARALAGNWDIDYLQKQYFDWLEKKNITPRILRAHFYDFVRRHRKRNGEG